MLLPEPRLRRSEWTESDAFVPLTYEKVVGLNNLLSIAWVARALELAASVARVTVGPGTGFLIGTDLLLTNNHVLPDEKTAEQALAEFNYQTNWSGEMEPVRRFPLDTGYFRTNAELDYSIVRVSDSPGNLFGFVNLGRRSTPAVNDFVSIIQHPQGGPKQICFTDNKVAAVFGDVLQYSTDTERGSSGSPVFNQNWEIVGLHHRGGELAGPDGTKYFTNQGVLISSIVRDAADFLGLSDALYNLAFGELRATLVRLLDGEKPSQDRRVLAFDLLRTRPRFAPALEDWHQINGSAGGDLCVSVAVAGIAIGGALRQWARTEGHESIKTVASTDPLPSPELFQLVGSFKGSTALPSDVYVALISAVQADTGRLLPVLPEEDIGGLPSAAHAFLQALAVGAKAYDGAL